jgi:hypothetical protein
MTDADPGNMPNALFYTFSTVAQTLGGGFGFLVAVVMFQIQTLNQIILQLVAKLDLDCWHEKERERFDRLIVNQDWGELLKYWHLIEPSPRRSIPEKDRPIVWLAEKVNARLNRVRQYLLWSLIPTAVTIGLCFLLLPFTYDLVALGHYARRSSVALVVVLAMVCLGCFARVVPGLASNVAPYRD